MVGCWRGCLGWGADLHIAQQMPLPPTVYCSSKSRLVSTFLVLPFLYSDPSGPVNPVNSCIFVAVLYFPVFCFCVLYFPVFLVDCTIVVVDLCFHYILLFSVALFLLLMKYNV